jgi:hypothetical protein
VHEAVQQLCSLGALQQQGGSEVLTPLGDHLADMPMDAAVGKALLYGCMLRWGGEWGARGGGGGDTSWWTVSVTTCPRGLRWTQRFCMATCCGVVVVVTGEGGVEHSMVCLR